MNQVSAIHFLPFEDSHFVKMHQWLQNPHVREFWDDGDRTIGQVKNHYQPQEGVKRTIFYIDGQTAGYIQTYIIDEQHEFFPYSLKDKDNIGIDFFIGNPLFLNKGHSIAILTRFVGWDIERIY